ncbi:uncharacterized protein Lgr1 [Macrobrachium rosenbergii]|uniref:uncharacterized protein Lgr1 n=1 Tax=Macrobrachium rosenbergii TaxID=79674 RepID=UPI0034D5535D
MMKATKGCPASHGMEIMLLKLLVMLNFYSIAAAVELQRSANDGNLFADELMAQEIPGTPQKGRNAVLIDPQMAVLEHNNPQPINDYLTTREKISLALQVSHGYDGEQSNSHVTHFQNVDKQKGGVDGGGGEGEQERSFPKSTNNKEASQRKLGNERKAGEFRGDDKELEFEKISLRGGVSNAAKGDKALERGFSIMETEARRTYSRQLTKAEVARAGSSGRAGGQGQQGFNQKKNGKREGSFPRGKGRAISANKKASPHFQFQEALPRDRVFPLGKTDGGKLGEILINPHMLSENSSTDDVIKDSPQESRDGTENHVLKGSHFNHHDRLASPRDIPSSDAGRQKLTTPHYLSNIRWRYRKHNHPHKSSRKENGDIRNSSISHISSEKKFYLEKVGGRGRRNLDDKLSKARNKNMDNQMAGANYSHPESNLATNISLVKNSSRIYAGEYTKNPVEWYPLEGYDASERNDDYYDPDDYWGESDHSHQYGGNNRMINMDDFPMQSLAVPGQNSDSTCGCWGTDPPRPEVECSCSGPNMKSIPANLSEEVFRITVMNAGLETLRNDSFTRYRATLRDVVLHNVQDFHQIEAGCFSGLLKLRSIYIYSAPKLKFIRNLTFTEDKLRSLRIVSSGLEAVPNLRFNSNEILHMIELDSNRIQKIHSRSLQVRVEELSLGYNHIQQVEREAFSGSYIGKLSLKGNQELTYLHPDAFEGIGSLRTLDLSETSITALPTVGLKELEVLRLENTPTLKVFPSVYSFRTIKEAHLTYPYHCCAFQFPEQHKKEQYVIHQKLKEMEQEHCSELTSPTSPTMTQTTRIRQRRYAPIQPVTAPTVEGVLTSLSSSYQNTGTVAEKHMNYQDFSSSEDGSWGSVQPESLIGRKKYATSRTQSARKEATHWNQLPRASYPVDSFGRFPDTKSSFMNSVENFDLAKMLPTSNRVKRSSKSVHVNEVMPTSKAKHYVSRHRRSRPDINITTPESDKSKSVEHEEIKSSYLIPLRHQMKQRFEPSKGSHAVKHARLSRRELFQGSQSSVGNGFGLKESMEILPILNKKSETKSAEVGDPLSKEAFDPILDKGFGTDEIPLNPGGILDTNMAEAGAGGPGGFQNYFLGFGPFNHSADRYPSDTFKQNDTLVGVWGDPEIWPGHGDSPEHFGYPEEGLIDEGGFVEKEIFSEDIPNTNLKNEDDKWHVTRAPMNNTTIIVLCGNLSRNYHDVMCVPAPDAFNPCEDIMGNIALRVAVWFVVVTAVVGNLAVMLVLVSSKFRMTVSKFLMVNLALADLSMGIYLLIIASMDLHTIGVYFNYAIDWQNGPGCKVAGFLTVFASELSIFTLTIITSERWYAITYAIHLNKRLKLSMAAKIMVIGWIYSITMATLPLIGISGYSKTSICLPMETGNGLALTYLISLLLVNGLAFIVITACYASMYCSISRHDASASHSDLTVAKRMALLVFTDFACWAPIAFFGLTAVAGIPLINVTRAKILLVFFYPLNSCANPYLYAILTKQYRRDLFILLARYGFCTKKAMRYKGAYSSVNNTFPHNTVVNAGPNHRNSTLTQITLCDLTRAGRTSQQSNSGSLPGTAICGSQDSLQKNISPSRTPTKPETCTGDSERLSTVQEMSHSNHSDDDTSEYCQQQLQQQQQQQQQEDGTHAVRQTGSPHPLKNCYARLSITPQQEQVLKYALNESKAKKNSKCSDEVDKRKCAERENAKEKTEEKKGSDCLQHPGQGETIVMYEVEIYKEASPQEGNAFPKTLNEAEETSTV